MSLELRVRENIIWIVREEFEGNGFAQKITYRNTGAKPKDLINGFRTNLMRRIMTADDLQRVAQVSVPAMYNQAIRSRTPRRPQPSDIA